MEKLKAILSSNSNVRFLTGTSNSDDFFESEVWELAEGQSIPYHIFVDQPFRLRDRFLTRKQSVFQGTPTSIFTPSESCADHLRSYFPNSQLEVIGYPQLEPLVLQRSRSHKVKEICRRKLVEAFDLSSEKKIATFVSEPESLNLALTQTYDSEHLIESLISLFAESDEWQLVIKRHPKELASELKFPQVYSELNSTEMALASDCLIGVKSIMLLEGLALGCPSYSLDYLNSEDERSFTSQLASNWRIDSWGELSLGRLSSSLTESEQSSIDAQIRGPQSHWQDRLREIFAIVA